MKRREFLQKGGIVIAGAAVIFSGVAVVGAADDSTVSLKTLNPPVGATLFKLTRQISPHVYISPDRQMKATVIAVASRTGVHCDESRVEIHRADRSLANTVDYSSTDGEHGYTVIKAHWTPDSQFFVYGMASSGGHQPWHTPTYFYSRKTNKTQGIEHTLGKPVLSPDFTLAPPATVTITTWMKPPLDTDAKITEDVKLHELVFTG
jgi:hypothetical protein